MSVQPGGVDLERLILLEADGVLAVNKCPDLPTSGRSLDDPDCLQFGLIQRHGGMVWAVHQLDADTSGVNLFTTARDMVEPLKRGMAAKGSLKRYLAVVHGEPEWESYECRAPVGSIGPGQLGVAPEGKSAHSLFQVTGRSQGFAVVQAEIFTGRTHQIRIHLSSLGHPLVGEEWYRREPCRLHPRQALHAEQLRVEAPRPLDLCAPLPDDLKDLLNRLGLADVSRSDP